MLELSPRTHTGRKPELGEQANTGITDTRMKYGLVQAPAPNPFSFIMLDLKQLLLLRGSIYMKFWNRQNSAVVIGIRPAAACRGGGRALRSWKPVTLMEEVCGRL